MVPVTVSFFSHKAGKRRGKTLQYAVLFAGGIIGSYMLLGLIISFLFGAEAVTQLAANPYVNLLLGAVFVLFAFSLIGWVNIAVPAGLLSRFDRFAAGRGEVLGTVLMGAVFTLTAFTCSVQFMGVLIVAAYREYAGGALPRLKTVLGILEIGIAVKFISNADLVWGAGLISRDTNLIIWVLLLAVAAGYLLLSDPHRRTFRISGARISAVFLLAPSVFVSFGLNDRSVGAIADSLLPPPVGGVLRKGSDYVPEAEFKELVWHPSYGKALEAAKASGRPVFIDFTGYTCINCRWMEQNIFARKEVFKVLQERYVIAKLYTDGGEYEAENRRLQTEKFDTVALPFYALTDADGNILKTAAGVMDEAAFLEFIR
ncbi:hypothetical protein CHS0354_027384 [Potamilus streckersoni]|uniref:Cytochrome C biogenesis protein transmembrane domain-containing protein n=1 Tax=Potamilus streckersoni TaxID=2493646 RepID=A0AAE0W008_9BIVA|nr:hypothetical protein CHS0354_027384 [Potamilus streckersoni]